MGDYASQLVLLSHVVLFVIVFVKLLRSKQGAFLWILIALIADPVGVYVVRMAFKPYIWDKHQLALDRAALALLDEELCRIASVVFMCVAFLKIKVKRPNEAETRRKIET